MPKEINTDRIPAEVFDKIKERAANRPEPINNTELVTGFRAEGGGILHIRPSPVWNAPGVMTRGCTVAFKAKNGRVEIATALTHRNDGFTKKIGTKLAIEHFKAGKTVMLPVRGMRPVDALKAAFYDLA